MYALVAERLGDRWAKFGLLVVFIALVCGGLTIIGLFLVSLNQRVIVPFVRLVPALPQGSITTAAISFGVTGVVVAAVGYALLRRWHAWENRFVDTLDSYLVKRLGPFESRLEHIEQNAPHIKGVLENHEHLEGRVKALEQHTDISGTRKAMIEEIAKRHPNV